MAADTMGVRRSRVEEMLEIVSLTGEEAERRVKQYSLGMRQRLGIAAALLGEPEVLILDEPANGLDPAGIRWMRDLLRDFADGGGTVLLSSHLLHEIEVIADDLVVIGNGRIVAHGSKADLLAAAGTVAHSVDDTALAAELHDAGHDASLSDGVVLTSADPETVGTIAHRADLPLRELRAADGAGLEEMFLERPERPSETTSPKEQRHECPGHDHNTSSPDHTEPSHDPSRSRSPGCCGSSCARCSTPGPASG